MKVHMLLVLIALIAANSNAQSYNEKVCKEISSAALSKSRGACAKYVRAAIQRARGEAQRSTDILSAKNYGPWLTQRGYIATNRNYNEARNGDVAVLQSVGKHVHGHIAIFCNKIWYSDFKQNNFYIYKDGSKPSYTLYSYQ